ncbi:hypothetical protein BDD12DRAFT_810798 [Trichophaea hybrida]|nr:hypothetical protein BDD12DRAFT_810798 [Trichophaea hybrida]
MHNTPTYTRKIEHYENGVLSRIEYEYSHRDSLSQSHTEDNRCIQQTKETPSRSSTPTKTCSTGHRRAHMGKGAYDRIQQKRVDRNVPLTTSGSEGPTKAATIEWENTHKAEGFSFCPYIDCPYHRSMAGPNFLQEKVGKSYPTITQPDHDTKSSQPRDAQLFKENGEPVDRTGSA